VTTKYRDSEGNIKQKKRAELSGKSVLYEGEYSETDSEAETELSSKPNGAAKPPKDSSNQESLVKKLNAASLGAANNITLGLDSIKIGNHKPTTDDVDMFRRQKLLDIPNIELKPVKVTEFNESIDEHSDEDTKAKVQAKIDEHLSINKSAKSSARNGNEASSNANIISDETKEDEKSDIKIIDSTDEKTGLAIRTSIENKMKTNENVKVSKTDNIVDVQETDDAIVKKITTKTRTTKSVVKTTTTTTTKKGIRLFSELSLVLIALTLMLVSF
jgi:hypothetical protein